MNKKLFKQIYFGIFIAVTTSGTAQVISQKIGNNPTIITNSAVLEIESTNKGVLIPRIGLTGSTDTSTISSPTTSLIIYNTASAGTAPNNVTPGFYFWNGSGWERIATGSPLFSEVDGIVGNELTDVEANGGLTRTGSGTALAPYKLKINDGTANGQLLTWDGTKWIAQLAPAEVDGIVGNELTDVEANGGLTRTGSGTALAPYKLKINDGTANGELLTWDGTKWVAQASTDWSLSGNSGTVAATNFIGTTDNIDFVTKTNNTEQMRITGSGNIGIGTSSPVSKLDVRGSMGLPISEISSDTTLGATHAVVRVNTSSGDITLTLPSASAVTNRIYSIIKSDPSSNRITFNVTINGNGFTFTQLNIPGEYKIQSNGTNWLLVN